MRTWKTLIPVMVAVFFAAGLTIPSSALNLEREGAVYEKADRAGDPPDFETAWQKYMAAFDPVRRALTQGDYKGMKSFLPHLKDSLKELRDSNPSPKFRKGLKKVVKYTKALLKAARAGKRDKIQISLENLKMAVDHIEKVRNKG